MAYVRTHGNQIAIVHGERDPETRKVQQRVLFSLYSRPEAIAALGRDGESGWDLGQMLEVYYPTVRFDWEKIRQGIEERMDSLPESYPYSTGQVLGRFRDDLVAFVRQLEVADPQSVYSAAQLLSGQRRELEYDRFHGGAWSDRPVRRQSGDASSRSRHPDGRYWKHGLLYQRRRSCHRRRVLDVQRWPDLDAHPDECRYYLGGIRPLKSSDRLCRR